MTCHKSSSSSSFLARNWRLRSVVHRPHPPQRPVLGHIHCFRQCEIVGSQILLYGAQPCDAGTSSWSPPVLWRESWQDPLGICVIVLTLTVPKRGEATWLDYCSEWLTENPWHVGVGSSEVWQGHGMESSVWSDSGSEWFHVCVCVCV